MHGIGDLVKVIEDHDYIFYIMKQQFNLLQTEFAIGSSKSIEPIITWYLDDIVSIMYNNGDLFQLEVRQK